MSPALNDSLDFSIADKTLKNAVQTVCRIASEAGGRALLVGGCVRDAAFGLPAEDIDIEVYGISPARLEALLSERFKVARVGRAFGVLKLCGLPLDVALPRRESKSGLGHKGFEIFPDPSMTVEQAARRRDFTMNAMALDPLTGALIDPCDGLQDVQNLVLRHTSKQFTEDPLRVLRGMQFVARFDLDVAPETVELCQTVEPEGLARERIFAEWKKLIVAGLKPAKGFSFLRDCGWIRYFPELAALIGCQQDPHWHPEGDVWTHTLHCMDVFAAERVEDEWEDLVVGFAVLCHDLGKPATTTFEGGWIHSKGHERAGEAPTRSFLQRLTRQQDLVAAVVPLVTHHLRPRELYKGQSGNAAVRRLALQVKRIDRLVRVARADDCGRPPRPFDGFPAGAWLLKRAAALEVESQAPLPIVQGRHLIALGLQPGPQFSPILDACFQAQIEGQFSDLHDGINFVKTLIQNL